VAASSVATRVAAEFGCALGDTVGYGVRFDFQCTPNTVLRYYTDGVLLRETLTDPLLSKYSVVIVDEAHVRSLNSDILLGLLKKIRRKRPDLRIIVTSATLDAMLLKNFFETNVGGPGVGVGQGGQGGQGGQDAGDAGDTAVVLSVQGRQYPVDLLYLSQPVRDYTLSAVETVLEIHRAEDWGDVLVFLPGKREYIPLYLYIKPLPLYHTTPLLPLYPIPSYLSIPSQVARR
jgi:ATP-dependent RNA helicase DDX35